VDFEEVLGEPRRLIRAAACQRRGKARREIAQPATSFADEGGIAFELGLADIGGLARFDEHPAGLGVHER